MSHRPKTSPVRGKPGLLEARQLRVSSGGVERPSEHLTLTGISHPATQSLPPNPEYYLPAPHNLLPFPLTHPYSNPPKFTTTNLDIITATDVMTSISPGKSKTPLYTHFRTLQEFCTKRTPPKSKGESYLGLQLSSANYILDSYRYNYSLLKRIRSIW